MVVLVNNGHTAWSEALLEASKFGWPLTLTLQGSGDLANEIILAMRR